MPLTLEKTEGDETLKIAAITAVGLAIWASFFFRYTPINESSVLDRWTGDIEAVRKPHRFTVESPSGKANTEPGHMFDEFESPAR